jgi:hypothetical protein
LWGIVAAPFSERMHPFRFARILQATDSITLQFEWCT